MTTKQTMQNAQKADKDIIYFMSRQLIYKVINIYKQKDYEINCSHKKPFKLTDKQNI